jgi:site-specific recombinase XerC
MPPPDQTQSLAFSTRAPGRRGRAERETDAPVRVFNPRDLNQVQRLIGSIPLVTIGNFRDRAIIGLLGYAQASPDEIIGMVVRDYFSIGRQRWIRLAEDGIERDKIVDRRVQDYIDEYVVAGNVSSDPNTPLFRLTEKRGKRLSSRPLSVSALRLAIRDHLAKYYETNLCEQMITVIKRKDLVDLRDRALIGMVLYTSAPLEKLSRMRGRDYYAVNGKYYAKLYGREPVTVPPVLASLMDEYLAAIPWPTRGYSPLFRASRRNRPIEMAEIREVIERRQVS